MLLLTRVTIEVLRHILSDVFLNLGAKDLSQNWFGRKIKLLPDEKCHGLGTQHENHGKKWPLSYDFGLRSPVIKKPIPDEKFPAIIVAFVIMLSTTLHRYG